MNCSAFWRVATGSPNKLLSPHSMPGTLSCPAGSLVVTAPTPFLAYSAGRGQGDQRPAKDPTTSAAAFPDPGSLCLHWLTSPALAKKSLPSHLLPLPIVPHCPSG